MTAAVWAGWEGQEAVAASPVAIAVQYSTATCKVILSVRVHARCARRNIDTGEGAVEYSRQKALEGVRLSEEVAQGVQATTASERLERREIGF